ncbi:MAG: sulfatase [Bacteroidota bacterium]
MRVRIRFRWWLLGSALSVFSCTPPPTEPPPLVLPERPHVVWLVAEDLSPVLPMYGDSTVATPTLSRLAREGVVFTNVFSVSGVCAPSRYALATGRYPTSDGAHHMRTTSGVGGLPAYEAIPPPAVHMLPALLRQAGYYTANNSKTDYQFAPPATAWDASSRTAHWRDRGPGQPFFAMFNLFVTHESQIWRKAEDSLWVDPDQPVQVPPYRPGTEVVQQDVRRMYSNIREMDAQAGVLLAELEAAGLLDSTIVVFMSDHGGPLPRQKRAAYDSGLHVPMIVRFPGAQRAGTRDDQLISFVDLPPTLLSLAGLTPPAWMQGQAVLGPARAAERTYVYAAGDRFDGHYDRVRAVRSGRFKYLRHFFPERPYYKPVVYREQMATMQELLRLGAAGQLDRAQAQWFRTEKPAEELFDTHADPHELRNLAPDPAYADTLARMRTALDQWMATTEDRGGLTEAQLIEALWGGATQPVTAPPTATGTTSVMLRSSTEGASIGYQVVADRQALGPRWAVYTRPVMLPAGHRLAAVAHRIGYVPSDTLVVPGRP